MAGGGEESPSAYSWHREDDGEGEVIGDFVGLVVPGRPVITDFVEIEAGRMVCDIACPSEVASMSMFLLPGASLAADKGLSFHWAAPPFEDFQLLGTLTPDRVSGVFYTGWPTLEGMGDVSEVRIGVALEDRDVIESLDEAVIHGYQDRIGLSKLIADHLVHFLTSFAQDTPDGEAVVLPTDAIDHWLKRFKEKSEADPDFLFRGRG